PTPSPTPTPSVTPTPTPTPVPSPTPTPTPPAGIPAGTRVETISAVNVRDTPSTSGSIKRVAQAGEQGTASGASQLDATSGNVFSPVNFDNGTNGFVAIQFLRIVTTPPPTP